MGPVVDVGVLWQLDWRRATEDAMDKGWDHSASGWLEAMGSEGDLTRRYVTDAPMLAALPQVGRMLDVGCGEGRFCRMAAERGLDVVGLDPTVSLLDRARALHPSGRYIEGSAEALPFGDASFDVVVFYMTLIDIPDFRAALAEAVRVLRSGGRLLIVNLHPYVTARPRNWPGEGGHWIEERGERQHLALDDMMEERGYVAAWGGIRITNYHRPLSAYMEPLLRSGMVLQRFEDPPCTAPDPDLVARYRRMPWAFMMQWQAP